MLVCYDHEIAYESDDCPMCTLEGSVQRRWRQFCRDLENIIYRTSFDPTLQQEIQALQQEIQELLDETILVEE